MRGVWWAVGLTAVAGCGSYLPGDTAADILSPASPAAVSPVVNPVELQGRWQLVGMERNGKAIDISQNYPTWGLRFDGTQVLLLDTRAGTQKATRLEVTAYDPGKTPKQFDLTAQPGHPEAGQVLPCIYAVDGDELVLMMGDNGKARPAALDSTKVVGIEWQVFKKMAPE